jgi:hypothetical protein
MQKLIQSVSCLLLALALVLSGPGASVAASGATMVVICSGDTPGTVWLDTEGNPVDPDASCYKCPECLMFDLLSADMPTLRLTHDVRPVPVRLVLGIPPMPKPAAYLCSDPRGPPPALPVSLRREESRSNARSLARMILINLDSYQVLIWIPGRLAGAPLRAA